MLHGGKLTKAQVQAWALNRYYYQAMIPIKDASLIARCPDPDIRREWRSRLAKGDESGAEMMIPDLLISVNAISSGLRTTG